MSPLCRATRSRKARSLSHTSRGFWGGQGGSEGAGGGSVPLHRQRRQSVRESVPCPSPPAPSRLSTQPSSLPATPGSRPHPLPIPQPRTLKLAETRWPARATTPRAQARHLQEPWLRQTVSAHLQRSRMTSCPSEPRHFLLAAGREQRVTVVRSRPVCCPPLPLEPLPGPQLAAGAPRVGWPCGRHLLKPLPGNLFPAWFLTPRTHGSLSEAPREGHLCGFPCPRNTVL